MRACVRDVCLFFVNSYAFGLFFFCFSFSFVKTFFLLIFFPPLFFFFTLCWLWGPILGYVAASIRIKSWRLLIFGGKQSRILEGGICAANDYRQEHNGDFFADMKLESIAKLGTSKNFMIAVKSGSGNEKMREINIWKRIWGEKAHILKNKHDTEWFTSIEKFDYSLDNLQYIFKFL